MAKEQLVAGASGTINRPLETLSSHCGNLRLPADVVSASIVWHAAKRANKIIMVRTAGVDPARSEIEGFSVYVPSTAWT